jgi:hypothetical protein
MKAGVDFASILLLLAVLVVSRCTFALRYAAHTHRLLIGRKAQQWTGRNGNIYQLSAVPGKRNREKELLTQL